MKPNREARTQSLATRFTEREAVMLKEAATASGIPLREWMREQLLAGARRQKDDPTFVELIAVRMLLNNVLQNIASGRPMSLEQFHHVMIEIKGRKRDAARRVLADYVDGSTPAQ